MSPDRQEFASMASPAELSRLTWWRRPRRLYILQYNCSSGSHHPPKSKYSKLVALALLLRGCDDGRRLTFWPPRRVQRWSSLDELLLPASSLTRNTRNTRHRAPLGHDLDCEQSHGRLGRGRPTATPEPKEPPEVLSLSVISSAGGRRRSTTTVPWLSPQGDA